MLGSLNTLDIRVAANSDDAEEQATGEVSLRSRDLELVFDVTQQTVGMRFNGITIPNGTTIINASIQFQVDEATSGSTFLSIAGEDADHAATFTTARVPIRTAWRVGSSRTC